MKRSTRGVPGDSTRTRLLASLSSKLSATLKGVWSDRISRAAREKAEQGRGVASPAKPVACLVPGLSARKLGGQLGGTRLMSLPGMQPKQGRMATPRRYYVTRTGAFEGTEKPPLLSLQPRPSPFSLLSRRLPASLFVPCLYTLLYFPQPCSSAPSSLPPPLLLVSTAVAARFGQPANLRFTVVAAGSCTREYTVKDGDYCDKISASEGVST